MLFNGFQDLQIPFNGFQWDAMAFKVLNCVAMLLHLSGFRCFSMEFKDFESLAMLFNACRWKCINNHELAKEMKMITPASHLSKHRHVDQSNTTNPVPN